jgi:hypothetical protein
MEVNMHSKDEKWAIFWCSLLHPVLFGEIEPDDTHRYLKKLSGQECLFPDGKKKKPSLSTLKRKLKKYKEAGFETLARKRRCDRGKPRAVAQEIIDKAIEIKRDQPKRSHHAINLFLKDYCNVEIPRSVPPPQTPRRHPAKTRCCQKESALPLDPPAPQRAVGRRFFSRAICTR